MSNPTIKINPENKYHQHRKEIYELWKAHEKDEPCDLSTACAEYRAKMGWGDPDKTKDGKDMYIKEFCDYVHSLTVDKTKEYFGC